MPTVLCFPQAKYEGDPIVITAAGLPDYVGQPPFKSDRLYEVTPPGVVMGLAWTAMGGCTLYAESALMEKAAGKVQYFIFAFPSERSS